MQAPGLLQVDLVAEGLTSEAARQFLAEMPTPAALMPTFVVSDEELRGSSRAPTATAPPGDGPVKSPVSPGAG